MPPMGLSWASAPTTAPRPSASFPTPTPRRTRWCSRDTSFRCGRSRAAYCNVQAIQKRPWIIGLILAGLHPSGVLCEIVNEDGTLARLPQLSEFKQKFGLKLISIAQLINYRHRREKLVKRVATLPFDSEYGHFDLFIYRTPLDGRTHFAFTRGTLDGTPTLNCEYKAKTYSPMCFARGN